MATNHFGSGNQVSQTGSNLGTIHNYFGGKSDDASNICSILAGRDPDIDREDLKLEKGDRVPGTCEWILEHDEFKTWVGSTSNSLWLTGGPGQGKTMITLHILDKLEDRFEGASDTLLFFFCNRRDHSRNTATSLLRSLLWQLISKQPLLKKYAENSLEDANRERSLKSVASLWKIFTNMISDPETPQVTCVLDGVDEIENESQRDLLRKLFPLQSNDSKIHSKLRLFVASRDVNAITLIPTQRIRMSEEILSVEIDILAFINFKLKTFSAMKHFDRIKKDMCRVLLENCQSTFLWIGLCIADLERRSPPATKIMEQLKAMPPGLDALYENLLSKVEGDKRVIVARILRWLSMAVMPLTTQELAAALDYKSSEHFTAAEELEADLEYCGHLVCVLREIQMHMKSTHSITTPDGPGRLAIKDYKVLRSPPLKHLRIVLHDGQSQEALQERFGGQSNVELVPITYVANNARKKNVVVLVHDSLAEFLVDSSFVTDLEYSVFQNNTEDADFEVGRRCLEYISTSCLVEKYACVNAIDIEKEYPFLRYASLSWFIHLKASASKGLQLLGQDNMSLREILTPRVLLHCLLSCLLENNIGLFVTYYSASHELLQKSTRDPVSLSLLHIAVFFDLTHLVKGIIRGTDFSLPRPELINTEDVSGCTPLRCALENSYQEVCQILLDAGVVPTPGDFGQDCTYSSPSIWRVLMERMTREDINNPKVGGAMLVHVVVMGPVEAVQFALVAGCDVNVQTDVSNLGSTLSPLEAALTLRPIRHPDNENATSTSSCRKILEVLIATGKITERTVLSTLLSLLESGNALIEDQTFFCLIQEMARLKTDQSKGIEDSCFLYTCRNGLLESAKLLLLHFDTVRNILAKDGRNGIHIATGKGQMTLAIHLQSIGMQFNDIGVLGPGTLFCAIKYDSREGVELMIRSGVDVNCLTRKGQTPLMKAAKKKRPSVFQVLLQNSADCNLRDSKGRTAIMHAARTSNEAAVRELLRQPNIALGICDKFGMTVLHHAAFRRNDGIMKLLMEFGLEDTVKDHKNRTALAFMNQRQVQHQRWLEKRSTSAAEPWPMLIV
jgi:ankyrin repeat protein